MFPYCLINLIFLRGKSNTNFWLFVKILFKMFSAVWAFNSRMVEGCDPGSSYVAIVIPKATDSQRAERWPHRVHMSRLLRCGGNACFGVRRCCVSVLHHISSLYSKESLHISIVLKINREHIYERSRSMVGAWPTFMYSQCWFIILEGLCLIFLLLHNKPCKMQ